MAHHIVVGMHKFYKVVSGVRFSQVEGKILVE